MEKERRTQRSVEEIRRDLEEHRNQYFMNHDLTLPREQSDHLYEEYERQEEALRRELFEAKKRDFPPNGYHYLIDGVHYDLVKIGGNGWGIGLDSTVIALDGPRAGKHFRADIGVKEGVRIKEELPDELR